jgi:hypothetical protein
MWCEGKPVRYLSALFKDLDVHEIVELTPTSGAAAIAAAKRSAQELAGQRIGQGSLGGHSCE